MARTSSAPEATPPVTPPSDTSRRHPLAPVVTSLHPEQWPQNLLLAGTDSVAVDAIASTLMGFEPLSIPFLRMAHERGLGIADPRDIELVGDDVSHENFGFQTRRSLVIWGDQMIRKGFLRPLERLLLHSPLMAWAPVASNVYHDAFWYPTIGRSRIRSFMRTEWGQLFRKY